MKDGTKQTGDQPEHEGTPIQLGKKKYILPPLSFSQLRRFRQEILDIQRFELGQIDEEEMKEGSLFLLRYSPLIHAALQRNYPEMTLEQLEDSIDLGDTKDGPRGKLGEIFKALFGISGMKMPGEPAGESKAVSSSKRSTGRASTAS